MAVVFISVLMVYRLPFINNRSKIEVIKIKDKRIGIHNTMYKKA